MALRPQERERGLTAMNEARQVRRRAIVLGRARVREAATAFWLMSLVGLAIFGFAYYQYTRVELQGRRSQVLSRQRAVAAAIGTQGFELRDRIESWVIALAEGNLPQRIAPEARLDQIANGPGIYLRIRRSEALAAQNIRKAVKGSLRDGFTSCLFVGATSDPGQGAACTVTAQCGPGELCGDWNVCAAPAHPYSARLLYDGLRVLTPEWTESLEAATNELQVRAIDLDLQSVGKHEAVAAAELVRRSRYFTAVLDEEPTPPAERETGRQGESLDEQLQAVDHRVRVGIWDLSRAVPLAVIDVEAAGRFVRLGSGGSADPKTLRAQQRQANNCAVATEVREALGAAAQMQPAGTPPIAGE
jgi:hypothetical protein